MANEIKEKEEKKTEVEIDLLKLSFYELKDALEPESEALLRDVTDMFWKALFDKLWHKEHINIGIRGEVATGKSTVSILIQYVINKEIERLGWNKNIDIYKHILSDQTEFIRFMAHDEKNVCVTLDEFNNMEKTGLNATTEEALFAQFSDVFAQKYIHRVSCSPSTLVDKNTNIILDVIGKDEVNKITRCKLTYRNVTDGTMICLGRVDFKIGEVLDKDFYRRYREKKFKRMELLDKHGIRDVREMEFSIIILDVIRELQDLARVGRLSPEIVLATVDEVRRRYKRVYSIITLNEIGSKARAVLGIYTELNKLAKKIEHPSKMDEESVEELEKAKKCLDEMVVKRMKELNELASLKKDYDNIE